MIKEITVAGIKLNNYSAHEKLARVERNLVDNVLTVIEDVYMRTLFYAKEDEKVKDVLETMDITEIADVEILDAVRASTIFSQKEIESKAFFFQLMKRAERNGMTVYIVAEKEIDAKEVIEYLSEEFCKINVIGHQLVDESMTTHEMTINHINMISPDIIISALPSPAQEHFLYDHKGMISAKIWYGVGCGKISGQKRSLSALFWRKFRHHKLKRYVSLDKE